METLQLNLIKRWFDLTLRGVKKEEYREITSYWVTRLLCMENGDRLTKYYSPDTIENICISLKKSLDYTSIQDVLTEFHIRFKKYQKADIRNGYKSIYQVRRFMIENKGISIGKGNYNWGFTGFSNVFIIHHGIIIEKHNIKEI